MKNRRIELKTPGELAIMDRCNSLVLGVLAEIGARIRPGVDIADLDAYAAQRTQEGGARAAFKGYHGYPSTLCVSINEQVVHGIPRRRLLRAGDIVSIDFGVFLEGFCGDGAETFAVGEIAPELARLVSVTREAMRLGIEAMRPGARIGDVGHQVQSHAEAHGFSVVRDYVGHGVGREMHQEPQLPNYGRPGEGRRLEEGMVLAIEPMVNLGGADTVLAEDGWTVSTRDGHPSAHVERSVAITSTGPWVLGTGLPPGRVGIDLPVASAAAVPVGGGRP